MGDLRLRGLRDRLRERRSSSQKIAAIREQIPQPAHDHRDRPARRRAASRRTPRGRRRSRDHPGRGSRARAHALAPRSSRRAARPYGPEDPFTFIYTSGTTGPPKGCVLTHGNYRAIIDMVGEAGEIQSDEVIYLYLPLAHSFALLIQLAVFDLGGTLAYFGGDTKQIVPELQEVKPTYLPSVPRVFEKIYTLAHGAIEAQPPEEQRAHRGRDRARREGARHDEPRRSGARGAAEALRRGRRAAVQKRARDLRRHGAPRDQRRRADRARDPRVLLGLRRARARGLRHDRDRDRRDDLDGREPSLRHRRARAARRRAEDRRGRRDPRQRAEHLRRATTTTPTPASARSRTAGCTPATSARSTRTATCRSPGARRTSSSPPAARTSRRRTSRTTSSSAAGSPRR